MEINKKKYFSMLGLITISIFIIGASYAYFTVSTTNNFGTHTISGTMEDVGAVSLVSSGNNITLNLTAADMMRGGEAITYFGTTDGTPTDDRDDGIIELAHTTVTGPGYYDCDYTIQITASGTNSMYTAFQNFANKGEGQITLEIGDYDYLYGTGDNGEFYDFNTASLFPITYNGTLSGVSGSTSKSIYGIYSIQNSYLINQTALAGTDITMTATVTNFSCTALRTSYKYWNTNYDNNRYDSNQVLVNNGYKYYVRTLVVGSEDVSKEVCAMFGTTEYCMSHIAINDASTIQSDLEALGATCTTDPYLSCNYGTDVYCEIQQGMTGCLTIFRGCIVNGANSAYCR